jgi:CRISPR-associated endonuclease Cas1/CRISPR-associated protein Cas4
VGEETLWSTRNVAEYAYCPRLFYLMEVEGVFLPSADTEEGCSVHKRVDRPSKATDGREEDETAEGDDAERPKAVRSLALTSERLGISARLDLAEIEGKHAVPVEHRKGRPRQVTFAPPPDDLDDAGDVDEPPLTRVEPWPTDRAQVGLQALLLEEAGYLVPEAVLYYAAEKRRIVIPFDGALRQEALDVLAAAKECGLGDRPPPLLNDPRCVKCSLQPLCLPDEVNLLRAEEPTEEITPRKIWPPRDDGIQVVVQRHGARVGVRGSALVVRDRGGKTVAETPLAGVESLAVLGPVQVTTQALAALADRCVPVAFMSSAGRLVSMLDPLGPVSAVVRTAQVRGFDDPARCLELPRALVAAKIANQRTILMRNTSSLAEAAASQMAAAVEAATTASSIEELRGHEGQAAAVYFRHFAGMLKGDVAEEFQANGRKRRPPPDPVNSCLSMGYSMLANECVSALRLAGLEPSIGAFHSPRPGRPALALDLMEPFRPLVADSVAISAFNRGELTDGHFHRTAAGCLFTGPGRKAFFKAWGRRMDVTVTHPVFEYRLSYRRMLMLHARMIAAWLVGEVPNLSFLTTR